MTLSPRTPQSAEKEILWQVAPWPGCTTLSEAAARFAKEYWAQPREAVELQRDGSDLLFQIEGGTGRQYRASFAVGSHHQSVLRIVRDAD